MKAQVYIWTTPEPPNALNPTYADHHRTEVETIKFLGLQLDNQIIWKKYIQLLPRKLSFAYFLMGRMYYILHIDSLKIAFLIFIHQSKMVQYSGVINTI